jgi:hypothetical protein
VLNGDVWGLDVDGNTAAIARILSLDLVDVSRPESPRVVGTWSGGVSGVDIVDTIAYVAAPYTGVASLSIANPAAPYVLDSLPLERWWNDIVVADSLAYVGGTWIHVLDVSNPRDLRAVGTWSPPYLVRRLIYAAPYLYAACYDAGVCILETVATGLTEAPHDRAMTECFVIAPNPTSTSVLVRWGPTEPRSRRWRLYDAAGRVRQSGKGGNNEKNLEVDLTLLETGVYFLEVQLGSSFVSAKVVRR